MLAPLIAVMCVVGFASMVVAQTTQPVQPTIEIWPKTELAGIATFGSPEHGLFKQLWDKFPANVEKQPGVSTEYVFGVSLDVPSHDTDKGFSYMAAGNVTDPSKVPPFLLRLPLPAAPYAVFPLKGGVPDGIREIGPMLDYAYNTWLPTSGYESAAPLNIERYHVTAEKTTIAIIIPLRRKP
jgi:predicted transcriptional regulator YdeE